jgi:sulfatase maturation enzyme AslB (radical SAM superfamily)
MIKRVQIVNVFQRKATATQPKTPLLKTTIQNDNDEQVIAKPSKCWPCERLKTEWRGCYHHRQCQAGHRCEAPGK